MMNRRISLARKNDFILSDKKGRFLFWLVISMSLLIAVLQGQTPEKSKTNAVNVLDKAAITGRVSADGRPAVGIMVRVDGMSGQHFSTYTDDNGEFRVDSLSRTIY